MTTSETGVDSARATAAVVERMAEAAANLLAALSPDQRRKATFGFPADEERRLWYYTPTDHGGVPLADLNSAQQQRVHRLVSTGLSAPGYVTASTIIGLENTLDAEEGWRARFARDQGPGARARDPLMYYVSVFGEPGGQQPWGWRFGGHHVSLNYTIIGGRIISPTPTFFGAHPAETHFVGAGVLRPLAGEEDLGRELLHALDAQQRDTAVLAAKAPWDIVMSNRSAVEDGAMPTWQIFRETSDDRMRQRPEPDEAVRYSRTPKGLPAARMTAPQRELLTALLRQYVNRMPDELAEAEAARLNGTVLDGMHFAWAGGFERRQPHYYRVQGPRLLVEYDNTQNDTNHIHAVWRDPEGDFGADLLARHYAQAH